MVGGDVTGMNVSITGSRNINGDLTPPFLDVWQP